MKTPVTKVLLIGLCLLAGINPSAARITMPKVFTDNLVLQQQTQAPIWGLATPNQEVTIITSWDKKTHKVRADQAGKWRVNVQTPVGGSTPYTITISDGKAVTLKNILIGEVWICSGQSNMDMPVAGWGWTKVNNYEQEIAAADYPQIRLLQVDKVASNQPLDDLKGTGQGWQVCSPATIPEFSAVAYFFGRNLYENLNVPIGLINAAWGGTVAEAWTSGESLDFMPDFSAKAKEVTAYSDAEAQKRYTQQMEAWNETVLSATFGSNKNWESPTFNDNDWQTMLLPGIWEEKGMDGFDGLVLFRKTVDIPAAWAGKDLQLNLGMIDDNDMTWFNGEKIGETFGYNSDRSYRIPARLVKAGKAVIAVHVIDYGGEGGFHGDPSFLSLALAAKKQSSISLANEWKYKAIADKGQLAKAPVSPFDNPNRPTVLHNAMIRPIAPYAIQGAIWYQGEANVERAEQYRTLFPLMIQDWRKTFGKNIPFYFVQLANYMDEQPQPVESAWAELRDAQLHTLTLENTGMAVAIDIGEAKDIHPKNKQDVGLRLALAARANTYKQNV
ncbi:MAG: 9-O-acetylesterase, partial [Bacteroidales bacterium]|nr:9-O-acetylesterase [Bacteroidales bacterium]